MLSGGDRPPLGKQSDFSLPAYSLPAEQLCGQIASAAEVTVAAPDRFPQLFRVLTAANSILPASEFREYVELCRTRHLSLPPEESHAALRYGELRAVFMTQAQRAIDNLQIAIGQQWRARLTVACFVFSFVFGVAVVGLLYRAGTATDTFWIEAIVTIVIVTIAGALIAPAAHDLMRALRSFSRS
jgi:hypothetical protein